MWIPPTVAQFQAQFPRDFVYGTGNESVKVSDIQAAINEGQGIFNPNLWQTTISNFSSVIQGDVTSGSIVIANLSNVTGLAPGQTISGAGIPSGASIEFVGLTSVQISVAATSTNLATSITVGQSSGYSVSEAQIAYGYLTAHLLVLSLQNAGGTGSPASASGQISSGGGIVISKSTGSVSTSYALPPSILKDPSLAQYLRTGYGQKYLQMLMPKAAGRRVYVVGCEPPNPIGYNYPAAPGSDGII